MIKYLITLFLILTPIVALADRAEQNLTAVDTRVGRYSTATFYSGESAANGYVWQPETLRYLDGVYGTEVYRMTFKPDAYDIYSNEYSTQTWSGDGSKIGFKSSNRPSSIPNKDGGTTPRWFMNSDGSKVKAGVGGGWSNDYINWLPTERSSYLFLPLTTEEFTGADLDTLYKVVVDADNNMSRSTLLADIGSNTLKSALIKDPITSDGRWLILQDTAAADWPTPNDINSYKVYFVNLSVPEVSYSWGVARGIGPVGDPVGDSYPSSEIKLRGSSSDLINNPGGEPYLYAHYYNYTPHFFMKIHGSATDGGPQWEDWDGDSFGTKEEIKGWDDNPESPITITASDISFDAASGEIRSASGSFTFGNYANLTVSGSNSNDNKYTVTSTGASTSALVVTPAVSDESAGANITITTGYPANPYSNGYMGHPAFDRWGHYVLGNDSHDCGSSVRWGNNGCPGLVVLDLQNNLANPSWVDASNTNYMIGTGVTNVYLASHSSWTGWTDQIVSMNGTTYDLYQNTYNKTTQEGKDNYQAIKGLVKTLDNYPGNYAAYPRPSQSPDGTKIAFSSILFSSTETSSAADDDYPGISVVVAYYPYPPEITACSATGGTVTATFEWMLDSTPRGYTQRGWPNEEIDDPPPPRETEKFRLWRSADKTAWVPIGVVNADIFTRYDFSDGTWAGLDYWTITDTPGDGTWYYAVTSLEWSGLESRTLSNIYAITISSGTGTGAQDTAYPASPGDLDNIATSDFYTSFNASNAALIKSYNIYAADGVAPTIQQQDLIATIPVAACDASCQYVDWLGSPDENTQYVVTAIDTQGNESTALTSATVSCENGDCSAASPEPTAEGQYLITWSNSYDNPIHNVTIGGGPYTFTKGAGPYTLTLQ